MRRPRLHSSAQRDVAMVAALVGVAALSVVVVRQRRRRASTHTGHAPIDPAPPAHEGSLEAAPPEATSASEHSGAPHHVRTERSRRGSGAFGLVVTLAALAVVALALLGVQVPGTSALLTDQVSMSQVSVTAGTVNAPTGLGISVVSGAPRITWTAPASGLVPAQYDLFRRQTPAAYGGSPLAQPTAAPYDDTSATQCSTWAYQVRSRHTNLLSGFASSPAEVSVYLDTNAPVISNSAIVATSGATPVEDFVKASGQYYAYASISDACAADANLTVSFALANLNGGTVTATAGSWTPVSGGATYNFRAGPFTTLGSYTNGQVKTWTITATDPSANTTGATAATSATVDTASPVFSRAEAVSAVTNYYDTALGYGEIDSADTSVPAAVRNAGFYVYGDFTDASGIASMTANVAVASNVIKTGATAEALAAGPYSTDNGVSWPWRSNAIVATADLADGATKNFTVTATDKVGNTATTSAAQTVWIDDTLPAAANLTCTNGGGTNDNILSPGEWTNIASTESFDPESILAGWDGSALTATATLRNNASADFFDFNSDFGVSFLSGSTSATAYNLAVNAVAANTNFASSTFDLQSKAVRVTYNGTNSASGMTNGNASIVLAATIREASGNQPAAAITDTCPRNPW